MPVTAEHGTAARWRAGCHCNRCREVHALAARHDRRTAAEDRFPQRKRGRLLGLIRRGASVADAADRLGLAQQTVHAYARQYTDWQIKLDAALMEGRDPDAPHGTPTGYRWHRCRCPECRQAHHRPD